MPIPDTPYTRKEAYLNAIATGDSSGIPETPYTREEMYLDAIAKGGGGGGGGGGSSTLSGLTDVDISNPSDGQTLVYNASAGKWENGAGGGGVLVLHANTQTGALDKTWQEIYDQVNAGAWCFVIYSFNYDGITGLSLEQVTSIEDQTSMGNGYKVICSFAGLTFVAQTPNDYPSAPMV